ncbi:MAG: HAMP domain-containing protein [Candidatus Latescibacteria bacterium]|nr:HAMP domain-containing protein [Candidatus Latescibacterota bacterium]NIO01037.1 HAMP domain-containing protein [Candidatus Latescibacterota bacterium]NIO27436.1 HAMP domain-containing protein [Candidatus Latescibacterota bacterium]NIO54958.1 HAMP domain-containing protein [Candidatus Latescibacterota bacterium]NIT01047.1 HAMP domain-containing protein [Candidatus Latescibacterota bacterium]
MKYPKSGRRTKVIIDKHFQLRTSLVGVLYILAVGVFVAFPFAYLMRATNGLLVGYPSDLAASFEKLQGIIIISGSFFLLSIMVAWIYFSLLRTHKVAGPIVNIVRIINEYAKGNFSARVTLRRHDELQTLAKSLNNMAEALTARERTLNEKFRDRLRAAREEIYAGSSPDKVRDILTGLEADIELILEARPGLSGIVREEARDSAEPSSEKVEEETPREIILK